MNREYELTVKISSMTTKGKSVMIKRLKRWIFLLTMGVPCIIEITDEKGADVRKQYAF